LQHVATPVWASVLITDLIHPGAVDRALPQQHINQRMEWGLAQA
jgi:hypothetical protein